jgi:hypothetical protein
MGALLRRQPHSVLLVVTVLAETLQSLATTRLRGMFLDLLVASLMLAVFVVVLDGKRQRVIGLLLGVPAVVTNWLHYILPTETLLPWQVVHHAFTCAFFFYTAASILRTIFRRRNINPDGVVGALCGYVFAGAAFGSLYTVVELLSPGAFAISPALAEQMTNWHTRRFLFGYFSLVTLTSMGYGDITPLVPAAVSLTWIEVVFGQFYLAVVVAQLVGMRLAPHPGEDRSSAEEKPR